MTLHSTIKIAGPVSEGASDIGLAAAGEGDLFTQLLSTLSPDPEAADFLGEVPPGQVGIAPSSPLARPVEEAPTQSAKLELEADGEDEALVLASLLTITPAHRAISATPQELGGAISSAPQAVPGLAAAASLPTAAPATDIPIAASDAGIVAPDQRQQVDRNMSAPIEQATIECLIKEPAVGEPEVLQAPLRQLVAEFQALPAQASAQPLPARASAVGVMPQTRASKLPVDKTPLQPRPSIGGTPVSPLPLETLQAWVAEQPLHIEAAADFELGPRPEFAVEQQLSLANEGEWLDQLAKDIAQTAGKEGSLRFRLNPETLGTLRVEVSQGQAGASVRLTADTEAARAIIADAQPRLVTEARAQGVRIAEAHVDLGAGQSGSGDARRQQDEQQRIVRTASGPAAGEMEQTDGRAPLTSERYA